MNDGYKKTFITVIGVFAVVFLVLVGLVGGVISSVGKKSKSGSDQQPFEEIAQGESLEELMRRVQYTEYTEEQLVKAPVDSLVTNMYDEMPEIDRYPLVVEGRGDVDIEIFSSGEKASMKPVTDSWLIKVADKFNKSGAMTSTGRSISMSVRSVPSGTGADYIISGKYLPDLYTPSNELFGLYAISEGGELELYSERTVGNTAGILVDASSTLESLNGVLDVVTAGSFNLGYTNPQSSAAGANLLIELLKTFGSGDMTSEAAKEEFSKFNNNIPYIAYTTQQMRDGASRGGLDGMVSEYQAYINDEALKSRYKFIPYGRRHDNPLFLVDKSHKSADELEAVEQINAFMMSAEMQELATQYGYNANDEYVSSYECDASDMITALDIYKKSKDSGRSVYAVFVADRSGSMEGEAIMQLKDSIANGMKYINDNNYVGLISYADDITVDLPINKFDFTQQSYFIVALNNKSASGGTHSYEALCVAVNMLENAAKDDPNAKKMIFFLSDGKANGKYSLSRVEYMLSQAAIPVYTIGYTSYADTDELSRLSSINEAASISADTDDVVYKIKSLFNAQL